LRQAASRTCDQTSHGDNFLYLGEVFGKPSVDAHLQGHLRHRATPEAPVSLTCTVLSGKTSTNSTHLSVAEASDLRQATVI
jgi:hypothetical protein